MSVAILTKFIGPTDYRPARIKAYTEGGLTKTISWEYGRGNNTGLGDVEANHRAAAEALAEKLGWDGKWVGGGTKEGYAFVNVTFAYGLEFSIPKPE